MSYLKNNNQENTGMPHLYWDKGFTTNPNKQPIQANQKQNYINPLIKEQILINKIKDWSFYIIVSLIILYCLYRILKGWLF